MFFKISDPVITTDIFKDPKLFNFFSPNFHECEQQRPYYQIHTCCNYSTDGKFCHFISKVNVNKLLTEYDY
ncbi:hypothetical protein L1283_002649 [Sphingobacterium sp. HSC-15S19]